MSRTIHMHADTAGILIEMIDTWPEQHILKEKFDSLPELVAHVLEGVGACPNIPMGCPTPNDDGTCPGHAEGPS